MSLFRLVVCILIIAVLSSCGSGSSGTADTTAEPVSWDIYAHLASNALAVETTIDPVLEYEFDNDFWIFTRDSSGNNIWGQYSYYSSFSGSGTLPVGGYHDSALLFSENGNLRVNPSSVVDQALDGDFAISLWFAHSDISYSGNVRLVSKKNEWDDVDGVDVEISAEHQRIRILAQDGEYIQASNIPVDYEWHHIVAQINGNTGKIYIDGVDVTDPGKSTLTNAGIVANDERLRIGSHISGSSSFQGMIDSFRLYDQALSPTDIANLYANEAKGNSLLAHYEFESIDGSDVTPDSTINNLDATVHDGTLITGQASLGQAMLFDGSATYVDCGGALALALTGQMTLSAVVRVDDAGIDRYMRIISKKSEYENTTGFELEYNPLRQRLSFTGSGNKVARANGIDLTSGAWHTVTAVVNGARVKFYVDGVAIDTYHDEAGNVILDPLGGNMAYGEINSIRQRETNVVIGSTAMESDDDEPKAFWLGAIDDVRIYDYPLTPAEIVNLVPAPVMAQ